MVLAMEIRDSGLGTWIKLNGKPGRFGHSIMSCFTISTLDEQVVSPCDVMVKRPVNDK